MAIIPDKYCEDCDMDGDRTPATQEWDNSGPGSGGWFLCERHAGRRQDAYGDSRMADYWGASTPQTIQEQYDAAAKQKRELDR